MSAGTGAGRTENGTFDRTDGEVGGSERGAESSQSDELGSEDEQHQTLSGGNRVDRTDLHLSSEEQSNITMQEPDSDSNSLSGSFSDKTEDFTELQKGILCLDNHLIYKRPEIAGYFQSEQDAVLQTEYLKNSFRMEEFTELYIGDVRAGYRADEDTDKKEAGTALVEMCKEIKTVNAPAVIGEYAGFKMAVSFDAFNHKFVMNLKGQLSHNLEVGSDPLGNISRINHARESMPRQLMEAQTKLETVEHQLETAKVEVTKPFAQEVELAEKLERLSALNALLNMDEKGNDGIDMDDEPEAPKSEKEVADCQAKNIPMAEKVSNTAQDRGSRQYADAPAERVSLKAKLEVMKAKVAGEDSEKPMPQKAKGKEVIM